METETALRVLIERREQDASLTREELNAKVKDLVVPYLELLKQTRLNPEQAEFVDLMETNLKNFYDPAHAKLSSPTYKLSPRNSRSHSSSATGNQTRKSPSCCTFPRARS
jgi:hypothetical protein